VRISGTTLEDEVQRWVRAFRQCPLSQSLREDLRNSEARAGLDLAHKRMYALLLELFDQRLCALPEVAITAATETLKAVGRALAVAKTAEVLESEERTIRWILLLAQEKFDAAATRADGALVQTYLGEQPELLARRIAPEVSERRPDALPCIQQSIQAWVSSKKTASRQVALAIYLRWVFFPESRSLLAKAYWRSSRAIHQRNHQTKLELLAAIDHCFGSTASKRFD